MSIAMFLASIKTRGSFDLAKCSGQASVRDIFEKTLQNTTHARTPLFLKERLRGIWNWYSLFPKRERRIGWDYFSNLLRRWNESRKKSENANRQTGFGWP